MAKDVTIHIDLTQYEATLIAEEIANIRLISCKTDNGAYEIHSFLKKLNVTLRALEKAQENQDE